ncbi:MAG: mannose-1-phosphate guanylyltransferase [Rikenellaceae bacterium]
MNRNHYCIIMAGGIGSRFWPISRNSKPKQFLDILGMGKSFLQQTFERFARIIPVENILVVTSRQYKDLVMEQIPEILPEHVLLEPYRRNTAPCISYATYKLLQKNPKATVVVAPSDHLIINEDVFLVTINNGLHYADKHNILMTLGVKPTRPETAYGYIQANMNMPVDMDGNLAYGVKTFTEKPNIDLAKVFIDSGEFLWNAGIFIWNLQTIKSEFEKLQPDIANLFSVGEKFYYTERETEYINQVYEECSSISVDYGIMEKTDKAIIYPVSFGWSDLGTWESLYAQVGKDNNNNHIQSEDNLLTNVSNSIVVSEEKEKLIVINGLDNYMVINTDNVLMICPRDESIFKNILTDLPFKNFNNYQ